MVQFAVNTHRLDPYKSFKFQIILDAAKVPGVVRVSPLWRRTETLFWRSGADASRLVTLERGLTHDTTFEDWAALAFNQASDADMSLLNFRKDMIINLLNQQDAVVLRYTVFRCWVSEYQALPQLDADGNEVAIEKIVLEHEGFARDTSVQEPQET